MFKKEFILDSEYRLVYQNGIFSLEKNKRYLTEGKDALDKAYYIVMEFCRAYPGYAKNKVKQYEHFIK